MNGLSDYHTYVVGDTAMNFNLNEPGSTVTLESTSSLFVLTRASGRNKDKKYMTVS